ncbi:MAG: helix-hairpin-helix domain-containing protein [Acetanaerobacterium sp.]
MEGIGPKRAAALLRHFKTLRAIREADAEALAHAPGMTHPAAQRVYLHFHDKD